MTKHLPEEVRREQILDAARKCFVEKGYFPTRMEDIAKSAGLSKGGIYFHFEGKRQIFDALVRQEYEESKALMQKMAGASVSYREMFEGMQPRVGTQFQAQTERGIEIVTVTAVDGDQVTIDANHPLAGHTLRFSGSILEVREASEDEIRHGHVHMHGHGH